MFSFLLVFLGFRWAFQKPFAVKPSLDSCAFVVCYGERQGRTPPNWIGCVVKSPALPPNCSIRLV